MAASNRGYYKCSVRLEKRVADKGPEWRDFVDLLWGEGRSVLKGPEAGEYATGIQEMQYSSAGFEKKPGGEGEIWPV